MNKGKRKLSSFTIHLLLFTAFILFTIHHSPFTLPAAYAAGQGAPPASIIRVSPAVSGETNVQDALEALAAAGGAGQENYNPASLTVTYGTLDAGAYTDLDALGGTDVAISEAAGANALQLTLGFTGVSLTPTNVLIYGNYDGSTAHQIVVEALNNDTAQYDQLGIMSHSTTKLWYNFPIYNGTVYAPGGVVTIRLRHLQTGIGTHDLYLDYVTVQHQLAIGGGGVTDHGALTGLTDPDHPASAVTNTPAGNIEATTVQGALNELDGEKSASGHNHSGVYLESETDPTVAGAISSHAGTNDHPEATTSAKGMMSAGDKTKVDGAVVDVIAFGAKCDVKTDTGGCSINSASTALTCTGATFTSGDIGKSIVVLNAGAGGGANLVTTIAAYTDATHVTLTATAGTTVSGKRAIWGTNDSAAFQAIIDNYTCSNLVCPGLTIEIPSDKACYLGSTVTIAHKNKITIRGSGTIYFDDIYAFKVTGGSYLYDTDGFDADRISRRLGVRFTGLYFNGLQNRYVSSATAPTYSSAIALDCPTGSGNCSTDEMVENIVVDHCNISDVKHAIYSIGEDTVHASHLWVHDNYFATADVPGSVGILDEWFGDSMFHGNYINGFETGIQIGYSGRTPGGMIVTNNHITEGLGHDPDCSDIPGPVAGFYGCGDGKGTPPLYGIVNYSYASTFNNNYFDNCKTTQFKSYQTHMRLIGNFFYNWVWSPYAISFEPAASTGMVSSQIIGNSFNGITSKAAINYGANINHANDNQFIIHSNVYNTFTADTYEGSLGTLSDTTRNNASTTAHGYLPKLDNNASHFLNGQGAWATALTSESDPKISTLTNGNWCTTNGSVITCTQDAPSSTAAGSDNDVQFNVSDALSADTGKFVYNPTTHMFGVGLAAPIATTHIKGTSISSGAITMTATNGSPAITTSGSITLNHGDYLIPTSSTAQVRYVTTGGTGTSFSMSEKYSASFTETFTIYPLSLRAETNGDTYFALQGSTGAGIIERFGNHGAFYLQRVNGSLASPTKILSGNLLGQYAFRGWYDDGAGDTGIQVGADLLVYGAADWTTNTNNPAYLKFRTNNGTALAERMQLTQDGHLRFVNNGTPSISSCGSSPSITGTDVLGKVNIGSGTVTSCTVSFGAAYVTAPVCMANTGNTDYPVAVNTSTTALTITTGASNLPASFMYMCFEP